MPDVTATRRIGIVGGECSGKSTLARALAEALPACRVDEGLRDFVDRLGRPPERGEQAALLAEQLRREAQAAADCTHPTVVSDPAPLMTAVYSLLYFDDPTLVPAAVEHAAGYDLLVWCDPGIPWVPDGVQRDGPDARAAADALIAELVAGKLQPRGVPVLRVAGDVEARVTAVRRAWQP